MKIVFHSTWGWKKSTLKTMFFAYIHSKMDYTLLAWQPWLASTNMARMESFQNCSLHIDTDQLVSTPSKALRMEANAPSYTTTNNQNVLKAK